MLLFCFHGDSCWSLWLVFWANNFPNMDLGVHTGNSRRSNRWLGILSSVSTTNLFVSRVEGPGYKQQLTNLCLLCDQICLLSVTSGLDSLRWVSDCPTSADPKVWRIYWTMKRIWRPSMFTVLFLCISLKSSCFYKFDVFVVVLLMLCCFQG